ncbi:MAG: AraC family transcriptional regulator [Lentisphaeria bacterium]|nr:AraC family transcriptional regulator [Lentisphaeria bacterium]
MAENIFTIALMKSEHDYHLDDWPVTVVNMPFGEQCQRLFHSHDSMEIGIVTAGRGVHIMDGERCELKAGDVILVPPGHTHGFDVVDGDKTVTIMHSVHGKDVFDVCVPMGILNILYDHTKLPIPLLDGQNIPLFSKFFPINPDEINYSVAPVLKLEDSAVLEFVCKSADELHKEEVLPYSGNLFGSTIRLLNVILTLLRNSNMQPNEEAMVPDKQLGNVLGYINANFMKDLKVPELARMSFISTRQFQEKFKKYTGRNVSDYIISKRIECAELLLRKGTQSIQEIAFDSGFNDFSYFSKKFREITGKTPREYRKNL